MHLSFRHQLTLLGTAVALLHIGAFFGTAALMEHEGASMATMIARMDQIEYMRAADTLLDHGRFALSADAEPEIFRTPGYPALIALTSVLTGNRYESIFVAHAILFGLIAILVALIGIELGLSCRNALLAGTLIGISSGSILLSATGTGSDIVYTFLYALAAYIAIRVSSTNILHRAALVGLVLGVATLTRPIGILASLPILLGFAILHAHDRRSYVRATAFALVLWVMVLAPWYARNAAITGTPLLSTVSTFNITLYNIPMNETFWRGTDEDTAQLAVLQRIGTTTPEALRGIAYLSAMEEHNSAYLKSHVIEYAVFHLYRTIPFFFMSGFNVANAIISHEAPRLRVPLFPTEAENLTRHVAAHDWGAATRALSTYWFTTLERLSWLLVVVLALVSPFYAQDNRRRILLLFASIIISNIILISPVTQARYRFPAEPFMWVTAVYTGAMLWQHYQNKVRKV